MRCYILLILLFLLACSPGTTTEEIINQNTLCIPKLDSTDTWLVADGGRSVVLPNKQFIHLFGDTAIKYEGRTKFVGNSIGLAKCTAGNYSVEYFWQEDKAFFEPEIKGVRLWPVDGFWARGRLFFLLAEIIEVDYGLGFDYVGTLLATVDNTLEPPNHWKIQFKTLTTKKEDYLPTRGIILKNDYAYVFSALGKTGNPPVILLRFHLDEPEKLQYLSIAGTYKNIIDFTEDDAKIILNEAAPSMYVSAYGDGWISINAAPEFGTDKIVYQTAEELEGPWSERKTIYKFPEIKPGNKSIICYAVAEHPQLRIKNKFVITYSCNTLDVLPSEKYYDFYRPKAVVIEL